IAGASRGQGRPDRAGPEGREVSERAAHMVGWRRGRRWRRAGAPPVARPVAGGSASHAGGSATSDPVPPAAGGPSLVAMPVVEPSGIRPDQAVRTTQVRYSLAPGRPVRAV